jgi:hypothetical protein
MPMPENQCPDASLSPSTIRPIGVYALSGLATDGDRLLTVDSFRGYLLSVDPDTNNTIILNPHQVSDWMGVTGLSFWQDIVWLAKGQEVFWCDRKTLAPTLFTRLPYPVTGVAVWGIHCVRKLSEVWLYPRF